MHRVTLRGDRPQGLVPRRRERSGDSRLRRDLPAAGRVRRRGDAAGVVGSRAAVHCPTRRSRVDTVTGDPLEFVGADGIGGFISGAIERFEFFELVILNVHVLPGRRPTPTRCGRARSPASCARKQRERPLDERVRRVPRRARDGSTAAGATPAAATSRSRAPAAPRCSPSRRSPASSSGVVAGRGLRCRRVRSSALRHAGRAVRRRSGRCARRARPGRGRRRAGRRAARSDAATRRRRPHARRVAISRRARARAVHDRRDAVERASSAPRSSTGCAPGTLLGARRSTPRPTRATAGTTTAQLVGARFDGHPWTQTFTADVLDAAHPGVRASRRRVDVARRGVPVPRSAPRRAGAAARARRRARSQRRRARARPTFGYPLAWCFAEGAGRVFSTSLGHFPGAWETPAYLRHLVGRPRLGARRDA